MSNVGKESAGVQPVRTQRQLPRTAKQVIDQAIKDNRWNGWLLFGLLTAFAVCGLIALLWGIIKEAGIVSLAGGLSSILLWPAITHARQIRRENIALRMLEVPLGMAESSKDASDVLKDFFVETFLPRRSKA